MPYARSDRQETLYLIRVLASVLAMEQGGVPDGRLVRSARCRPHCVCEECWSKVRDSCWQYFCDLGYFPRRSYKRNAIRNQTRSTELLYEGRAITWTRTGTR